MPWSVEPLTHAECGPRGDEAYLANALDALGFGSGVPDDHKPAAIERIDELARGFNAQRALANGAPTIKDIRERLNQVEKATKTAAAALRNLDDVSIDWLFGRANIPGIAFSFRPPWTAGLTLASFNNEFGLAEDVENPPPHLRRDYLAPLVGRLTRIAVMAAGALAKLDAYKEKSGHRGPRGIVEMLFDSAKVNLVEGCYALAEEYVDPNLLTTSVRPGAPLARLARAVFQYATGECVDNEGNGLDRAIGEVAKERAAYESSGMDRLNYVLRQEHTKPR